MNNDRGKSLQIPQSTLLKKDLYTLLRYILCTRRTSQVILNISLRMK